jgi:hypothetical protein
MHLNYQDSQVRPNGQGSRMHPNGQGSWAWPGWGRRCVRALPLQLALCTRGSGFAKLKTSRQIEMQHVFYIAMQYEYYTYNMHNAQISILHLTYAYGQHINVLKHFL